MSASFVLPVVPVTTEMGVGSSTVLVFPSDLDCDGDLDLEWERGLELLLERDCELLLERL